MATPFYFSSFGIKNQVFYRSALSIGFVNLKPLVSGHVLVSPKRVVARLSQLSEPEISDLFLAVQTISQSLEKYYEAPAMTISIQDGAVAGQTVPHVHVHLLPRKKGDFDPPDKVYDAIDSLDLASVQANHGEGVQDNVQKKGRVIVDDELRFARGKPEMRKEAEELSLLFPAESRGEFSD